MDGFLALMIPIVAILGSFGVGAYRMHLQYRGASLSGADRQLIESLQNAAQRLEFRVATLERALLDAEAADVDRGRAAS